MGHQGRWVNCDSRYMYVRTITWDLTTYYHLKAVMLTPNRIIWCSEKLYPIQDVFVRSCSNFVTHFAGFYKKKWRAMWRCRIHWYRKLKRKFTLIWNLRIHVGSNIFIRSYHPNKLYIYIILDILIAPYHILSCYDQSYNSNVAFSIHFVTECIPLLFPCAFEEHEFKDTNLNYIFQGCFPVMASVAEAISRLLSVESVTYRPLCH